MAREKAGGKVQKASEKTERPPPAKPPKKGTGSDARLYTVICGVAVGLAALVWWSLPGDHPGAIEGATSTTADPHEDPHGMDDSSPATIGRPPQASAEFAVITEKPDDVVRNLATASEIGKRLDVPHCGGACDAVRKFMGDEDRFDLEIMKADDLILPPKDTMDTVAPGLTPRERDSVRERKTAVMVRTHGPFNREQVPARTAFAVASVLAEALDGFVYDEVSRRIETSQDFASHTVVAALGETAFARKQIVIQLYRQPDGTARLLTLGMARYGCPDLSLRGAHMSSAPLLAEVMNTAASMIVFGNNEPSFQVSLDDVARVVSKKPAELSTNVAGARPVLLTVVEPERIEGDPDNELAELLPWGGSTRENWDVVVASLFGTTPSMNAPVDDAELAEVAKGARKTLPGAIKRFQAGEGELYLKGPFPIPPESRADGGAATELLWISAASCDPRLCTGVLSNEPAYATNLAAGKVTSVARAEALDWMLHQRDGGNVGGESINVLKARAK